MATQENKINKKLSYKLSYNFEMGKTNGTGISYYDAAQFQRLPKGLFYNCDEDNEIIFGIYATDEYTGGKDKFYKDARKISQNIYTTYLYYDGDEEEVEPEEEEPEEEEYATDFDTLEKVPLKKYPEPVYTPVFPRKNNKMKEKQKQ